MCGISGYFLFNGLRREADTLVSMLRPIRHRGPDDEGVSLISRREGAVQHLVTDESIDGTGVGQRLGQTEVLAHDIGLGHRRFSIIDISPAGHPHPPVV